MRISKPNKTVLRRLLPLFALMLCMGVFLCAGAITAYAADINVDLLESLSVDDVWLTGETLHISVTDKYSGEQQTLELNLRDYAKPSDEYVTVQAVDTSGRTSNTIQFKNPFYVAPTNTTPAENGNTPAQNNGTSESAVPNGAKPFTPGGTGTVVDNATDGDGKEFFTVTTEDGNIFYLIVDRQRTTDNVYLLNAVTEDDLMALAEKSGKTITGGSTSAIPDPNQPGTTETPPPTTSPESKPTTSGGNNSTMILIVIAVIAVGGAGYYFKIVRPKQNGGNAYDEDDEHEDFNDNEELDMTGDGEDGDEE